MSLLFLTEVLDSFRALDDAGRPLPGAVLTFWQSGTTTPAAVYADQELRTALSDAQGRVTADSQGRFPLIYLDPDVLYRVRLTTAQGVLRWDVDPYLCDCTDPPRLFRNPVHQALARISDDPPTFAAPSQPGARLRFTLTESESPRDVYADAARTVPLPNPLRANAAGIFPPIYLDDETLYRVVLETASGEELLEVDPYECQCGFLLLTSRPYAIEALDALDSYGSRVAEFPHPLIIEAVDSGGELRSGELRALLVTYDDGLPEAMTNAGALLSGDLDSILVTYNNGLPEALDSAGQLLSGTLS